MVREPSGISWTPRIGRAVLLGAAAVGADLDHRDDPPVEVDAEAGQGQGLHVAHHLLGRLVGRGEDVDLAYPIAVAGDSHRVDRRQAGEGLLEFPIVHAFTFPRHNPTT